MLNFIFWMSAAFRFVFVSFFLFVRKLTGFSEIFPIIQSKWASTFFWYQDKVRQLSMENNKPISTDSSLFSVILDLGVKVFSFEASLTEVWHLHSSADPKIIQVIPQHALM